MFQINRPIMAAVALDEGSHGPRLQAHNLACSYNVELHVGHVLPEIFEVRPLFPHLHLDDALKLAELEAGVYSALLERIQKVASRIATQVVITIEQGAVHAGILRGAENIDAGAVVVGGKVDRQGVPMLGRAAELVVRYAHCPVLVARPSSLGRVLTATDFSDPSLPAVESGAAEAGRHNADLVVFHAVDLCPLMVSGMEGIYPDSPLERDGTLCPFSMKRGEIGKLLNRELLSIA